MVIFHIILYSFSMLYVGFRLGLHYDSYYSLGWMYYLIPVFYLLMLVKAASIFHSLKQTNPSTYIVMAIVSVVFSAAFWLFRYRSYLSHNNWRGRNRVDVLYYPGIMFGISLIVAILYAICAFQTQKVIKNRVR